MKRMGARTDRFLRLGAELPQLDLKTDGHANHSATCHGSCQVQRGHFATFVAFVGKIALTTFPTIEIHESNDVR